MKRHSAALFLSLLPILLLHGCHRAEKPPLVISQALAVNLDPATHSLSGTSTFSFIRRNADVIFFDLAPQAAVLSVREGERNLPFAFSKGKLSIPLSSISSGNQITLSIQYRGIFNDMPQDTVSTEDPTYGVTAVIGSEGVFLGSDAGWYPVPEPLPKERSLTVTVPPGFRAITGGERIAERTEPEGVVSVWNVTAPGEKLALSAGPYQVAERLIDGITVATYFFEKDSVLSDRYLTAAVDYLRFYQGLFGPYPYKKFAVVENFLPTGYGFPSYTLIGSSVLRLPFIANTSLPHEIVHCWWGNSVRVDYREGNWSEGLATYLADYLLEEKKSPKAAIEYRRRILSDYASLVPPADDFSLSNFSGRVDPASRSIGYGKGAMLFHMVRIEIGDKAFFQGLRNLIQDKLYQKASWDDFIRVFSATSGRDLTPFFRQWLHRTGGPRLSLHEIETNRDGTYWRVNGVVRQTVPDYDFPLSIRLENSGDPVTITVPVKGERTPFSITSAGRPRRLVLDPDADLFRILSDREIPPSVNGVKGSRDLVVIRTETCRADAETLALLLKSMGQSNAAVRREREAAPETLKGHDLLLCGIPRRKELIPQFDSPISISSHSFTIGATRFDSPEDSLFAVAKSGEGGGVTGIFYPLSATAARESVLKITHYGKYGYLAFRGGTNIVKGFFPGRGGGTVVSFTGADNE